MKSFVLRLLWLPLLLASFARPLAAQPSVSRGVSGSAAATQCLLEPLDPAQRAAAAVRIVEAAVTSSQGVLAPDGRLYTRHQLRVFRQLKGPSFSDSVLTVFTEGGTVGLRQQVLTNTLQLAAGEQGIFFLEPATAPAAGWQPYGSQQGFIRYNLLDLSAAEPFRRYETIAAALGDAARTASGPADWRTVQPNPALAAARKQATTAAADGLATRPQVASISGLAPLSLAAGTGAVLTITGSGFGAERGTVELRNADDGGATFTRLNDDDYLSWADTRITVRVPSQSATGNAAGTGPVRVTPAGAGQLPVLSPGIVTVVFAASTARDTRTGQRARPAHRDQNGTGGLTFRFEAGFAANTAAVAAWSRALATWRCQTSINWELGPARTATGVADDGENSVGFDTVSPLPAGILGRTTSYYRGCYLPDGSVVFYVQEIDVQYSASTAWQFGPAAPSSGQLDFESVAVHELGHAQQLAHLIRPAAIMHYAIGRGQRSRTLDATSDVAGGRYVLRTGSFRTAACGPAPMLPAPLIAQQATPGPGGVHLVWTTRDECNLTGFRVERASLDTTAGWQLVAQVAAGASEYNALDAQPLPGLSYYRLRLLRPDGSLDTARPLPATDAPIGPGRLLVFPNPLGQGEPLHLQYQAGATAGQLTLRYYDAVGRDQGRSRADYGPNLNVLRTETPANLAPGLYLLRWTDSNGPRGTVRLLVQ